MQKKNVLTMALSVSLVGVIAVGGTLAYLTANTKTLTNNFTFTTNGITLQLKETAQKPTIENGFYGYTISDLDEKESSKTVDATSMDAGITYENIVPGAVISKKPVLTVPKNTVNCYVYAIVNGVTDLSSEDYYADFNTGNADGNGKNWVAVDHASYSYIPEGATVLRYSQVVETSTDDQALEPLFTKVTLQNNVTEAGLKDFLDNGIKIEGYSIQSDTFAATAAADTEALTYFDGLFKE